MGGFETFYIKQIIFNGSAFAIFFLGIAFTVWAFIKRFLLQRKRITELEKLRAAQEEELRQREEAGRRQAFAARRAAAAFYTRQVFFLYKVMDEQGIQAMKPEYREIVVAITEQNQLLEKESREQEFIEQYMKAPLYSAVQALALMYLDDWKKINTRINMVNTGWRFRPSSQLLFLRMVFSLLNLAFVHCGATQVEISLEQDARGLRFKFNAPGLDSYPELTTEALALVQDFMQPGSFSLGPDEFCIGFRQVD